MTTFFVSGVVFCSFLSFKPYDSLRCCENKQLGLHLFSNKVSSLGGTQRSKEGIALSSLLTASKQMARLYTHTHEQPRFGRHLAR